MAQSVTAVWANLYAVCQSLYPPPVLVSFGDPGTYQPDVIVAVMGGAATVGQPVMTPTRPQEFVVTTEIIFSVFAPGGDPTQQASSTAAWVMHDQLVAWLRTSPNETLSGACRSAFVTAETVVFSNAFDPVSNNQTGCVTELTATVTAHVRI